MDEAKLKRICLEDMLVFSIGAALLSLGLFAKFIPGDIQLVALLFGFCLSGVSVIDLCRCMFEIHPIAQLKRFRDDTSGLGWVLIVGFGLTLPMCALVYWLLDYPFEIVAEQLAGLYTLTGTMSYAWMATHVVVSYLLAFVLIYAIIWVIVNAKSPSGYYG